MIIYICLLLQLQSPIKSVSISGSVQNDDKFRISLLNIYDQKQPLTTTFTFDPSARAINFVTNYDEGMYFYRKNIYTGDNEICTVNIVRLVYVKGSLLNLNSLKYCTFDSKPLLSFEKQAFTKSVLFNNSHSYKL